MTHATMEQAQGQSPVRTLRKPKPGMSLAERFPEVAAEWHPTKNDALTPEVVTPGSDRKVWWVCDNNHEWEAVVSSRSRGNGCRYCSGREVIAGFNDLATLDPVLAAQWHPTKNGNLTPAQVTVSSSKRAWWVCDNNHEWEAPVYSRSRGKGCSRCARSNTSKAEATLVASLRRARIFVHSVHNKKLSGVTYEWVNPSGKTYKACISPDLVGRTSTKERFVIEYDGSRYHSPDGVNPDAHQRDILKTRALLDAGYKVVRVRASSSGFPLSHLPISDPNLLQISHVEGQSLDPVVSEIVDFVKAGA